MNTRSYISAPNTQKLHYSTVLDLFDKRVRADPNKEIVIHRRINGTRRSITLQTLQKHATNLARYLIINGVKKGDRIALSGLNTIDWVVAEFAIFLTGAVLVNIGFTVTDHVTIMNVLQKAQCKTLIFDTWERETFAEAISKLFENFEKFRSINFTQDDLCPPKIVLLRKSEIFDYPNLQDVMDMEFPDVEFPVIYPEDPVAIFSTSGSTGESKLFEHTHFALVNMIHSRFQDPIKVFNPKFFGSPGGSPEGFICRGQARVYVDSSIVFDASYTKEIWEVIKSEKCVVAECLPQFLSELISMKNDSKATFRVESMMVGGQVIDSYYTQVLGRFCNNLHVGYGAAETGLVSKCHFHTAEEVLTNGIVGKPKGDKEVKIIDADGAVPIRGTRGEICVRSNYMIREYIGSDEQKESYLTRDNWFRTGDIGYITEDGELVVCGRLKEMIMRGTDHILPKGIEGIVMRMPEVKSTAVVAIPDRHMYEEVCVCYVSQDRADIKQSDVKKFCEEQYLLGRITADHGELPKYYLPFDKFPLLSSGKPNKGEIKRIAIRKLGESADKN